MLKIFLHFKGAWRNLAKWYHSSAEKSLNHLPSFHPQLTVNNYSSLLTALLNYSWKQKYSDPQNWSSHLVSLGISWIQKIKMQTWTRQLGWESQLHSYWLVQLSMPQFFHQTQDNISPCRIGWLQRSNELLSVKCLTECLAHRTCCINKV